MTRATKTLTLAAVLLCGVVPAAGAEGDDLDKLFEAVGAYKFGQDEKPLIAVTELVRTTHNDPKRREQIERRLDGLLATGTPDCKRFVCRQLWMAASVRSVPALTRLLADEELANAARYALERLDDPAVGAALREAVGKSKGKVLIGVINSLGDRRDKQAAPLLLPLLAGDGEAVVASAAWALGRIGGADSGKALLAARAKAGEQLRPMMDDACLLCADALVADGKGDEAAGIYQRMYAAGEPRRVRIAALRGLMIAQPGQAAPAALQAMRSPDPQLSAVAAALLRELPGEAITRALADELPKLAPDGQVTVLAALARRGDAAGRPAVVSAAASKDPSVRVAALTALAELGAAADVPLLADAACQGPPPVRAAARTSLVQLRGAGVESAIVALLKTSPQPVQVELIGVLSARWAAGAAPELLALAGDKDAPVRAAAMNALATLAGEKELPAMVALLARAPGDDDRAAAAKAIASAAARAKDKHACAAAVLDALDGAQPPARAALLGLLPLLPSDQSLAAVRAAGRHADPQVSEAAVRALADWPTADALEDLLTIAAAGQGARKVLALRGCVRVLGRASDRAPADTVALYARLMKLASRADEKKFVLAGLAEVGHADALKLIEPLLSDAAVRAEAQAATVKVARAIAGADYDLALAALEKIAAAGDERAKQDAAAAIGQISQNREFILAWMLSGPYMEKGKSGPDIFAVAFPPEKPGAADVKWRPVSVGDGQSLDLARLIGGEDRCVYLRTTVISPRKLEAVLEMGSDDGIKAWLNGKLIHSDNASRSLKIGQDKVKVTLQAGENPLMLEIINGTTDWGASARVVGPDGKPIPGLKTVAK